jgi:uncharacterized protein YicC (UPF0701 family)
MNYEELIRIPNALDILNITRNMEGCAHFDKVSPLNNFNRLQSYINNLKKLYPNIAETELNKMIEDFEADMAKQVEDNDYEGLKKEWVKVVHKD